MQTTGTLKVGIAFLTGVMLALGGAVVYLRTADSHVKQQPATAVTVEQFPAQTPDSSMAEQKAAEAAPVEKADAPASKPDVAVSKPRAKPRVVAAVRPRVTSRPVSLAVPVMPHPQEQQSLPAEQQQVAHDAVVNTAATGQDGPAAAMAAAVPAPPLPPQPHTVTIPAGTDLAIRLGEKLSTEHNFTGDTFRATLDTPIITNGFIIADRGARVLGRIVKAQKAGKFDGMAELSLVLTEISTTDGQRMAVETNQSLRKGPSNTNEEVIKMAGGAALGAIIGAIAGGGKGAALGAGAGGAAGTGAVLLGKGKPAVIANETRLTFQLAAPTTITEKLN